MELVSVLLPPLIGGVIGYITNDLAIKMLFRPYKAVYIGAWRVPFTPGIVPKRLKDLAVLLGREVEARFFNADDLEILFKSDGFSDAVAGSVTELLYSRKTTLCLELEKLEADGDCSAALDRAKAELGGRILAALLDFDFAPVIRAALDGAGGKMPGGAKNAASALAEPLSDGIKAYLKKQGAQAVAPLLDGLLVDFADRPVRDIALSLFPDRETVQRIIKGAYQRFMAVYVRPVVESIDVGGMITEKLRRMEPEAVETLILSVVKREFRYVVWLGGLLGARIGTVNIFL